mmetsp:Transcript_9781/g.23326  ORF Transcript_9781/g.23326 Transcript_9781/m.23326 type:complete len:204 (+) Transcript_9781:502-1113(+)
MDQGRRRRAGAVWAAAGGTGGCPRADPECLRAPDLELHGVLHGPAGGEFSCGSGGVRGGEASSERPGLVPRCGSPSEGDPGHLGSDHCDSHPGSGLQPELDCAGGSVVRGVKRRRQSFSVPVDGRAVPAGGEPGGHFSTVRAGFQRGTAELPEGVQGHSCGGGGAGAGPERWVFWHATTPVQRRGGRGLEAFWSAASGAQPHI